MQLDLLEVKRMPADTRQGRPTALPSRKHGVACACVPAADRCDLRGRFCAPWQLVALQAAKNRPCGRATAVPKPALARCKNWVGSMAVRGTSPVPYLAEPWYRPLPVDQVRWYSYRADYNPSSASAVLLGFGLVISTSPRDAYHPITSPPPCPGLLATPEVLHRGSVLRYNDLDSLVLEQTYRYFSAGARASCTAAVLHGVPCYD